MIGYARIIGATADQAKATIDELTSMRICDSVTEGNGNVTLINRRMLREEKERILTRSRVRKFRNADLKRDCNADVTVPSSSSSSSLKDLKAGSKPVDNSKSQEASPQPSAALSQKQKEQLAVLCENVKAKRRDFNPYAFIGHCLKNNIHPEAQILALQRLDKNCLTIPAPWPYCCKIVGVESGNFNERDFLKAREEEGNLFQQILGNIKKV
jgi:hypothetical protein